MNRRRTRTPAKPRLPYSERLSPTELRNPRSLKLDTMPVADAVRLFLSEEAKVTRRLMEEVDLIQEAVARISDAFRKGGRLFYVGAGTSGRLGVLDASECPPTFRTKPKMVQGILAGGRQALWKSMEGAEDDYQAGAEAIRAKRLTARDVVVGIAASGTTPFMWGALGVAREKGAGTILVCFNPHLRFPEGSRPDIVIAPDLGPELLTGSTRLKAGTATKLLLNLFTTLSMVQSGKVMSNLMVDLNPSNAKLKQRAIRITRELTGATERAARLCLEKQGWSVRDAIASLGESEPMRTRR